MADHGCLLLYGTSFVEGTLWLRHHERLTLHEALAPAPIIFLIQKVYGLEASIKYFLCKALLIFNRLFGF